LIWTANLPWKMVWPSSMPYLLDDLVTPLGLVKIIHPRKWTVWRKGQFCGSISTPLLLICLIGPWNSHQAKKNQRCFYKLTFCPRCTSCYIYMNIYI
jgi:hypothetical protein